MDALTPKILNIPKALAARYANPDTERYEELVAAGNLALVEGVRRWRPDGGQALSSFLYDAVRYALLAATGHDARRQHETRWAKLEPLEVDPYYHPKDTMRIDDTDTLQAVMKKVPPLERAAYTLRYASDLGLEEIARRMETTRWAVQGLLKKARLRISRRAQLISRNRGVGHLIPIAPPRSEAQRKAAAKFCRDRATERRALGLITPCPKSFYLVDGVSKVLHGPDSSMTVLLRDFGIAATRCRGPKSLSINNEIVAQAKQGWSLVRGSEAVALLREGFILARKRAS